MSESEIIQELIEHWVAYSKTRSDLSIASFSKWLTARTTTEKKKDEADLTFKKMELGRVFGRLTNFSQMWGKLAFKDLPIKQFEDFGILMEAKYRVNPSKNEVANLLLNEKSTAFEIIKRLIREGLLVEKLDENDKRIRRISLTPAGEKVVDKAEIQAGKVSQLLMGDSSEEEIDFLLSKFSELDKFHTSMYEKGDYEEVDDLLK